MYLVSSLWKRFFTLLLQSHFFFLLAELSVLTPGDSGASDSYDSYFFSPGFETTPALFRIGLRKEAWMIIVKTE